MRAALLALALTLLPFTIEAAPPVQEPATVTLPPPLARVLTDYEAAWRTKDSEALSKLFVEDGFVLSSGGPAVHGRAGIGKHYTGQGGPLFLRAFAYATDGSVGYILGGYRGRDDMPDEGKFTLTLRKGSDGVWKIVSDMDNTNTRR